VNFTTEVLVFFKREFPAMIMLIQSWLLQFTDSCKINVWINPTSTRDSSYCCLLDSNHMKQGKFQAEGLGIIMCCHGLQIR